MKRTERAGWVVATVALAALVASLILPSGAFSAAATELVSIANKNGPHTATVDTANQLLASPAAPSQMITIVGGASDESCYTLYTVPAGKALVLTGGTQLFNSFGALITAVMFSDARCSDVFYQSSSPAIPATSTVDVDFGGGVVLPSGSVLSALLIDNDTHSTVSYYLEGYLIPAAAAPANSIHTAASAALIPHNGATSAQ